MFNLKHYWYMEYSNMLLDMATDACYIVHTYKHAVLHSTNTVNPHSQR